MSPIALRTFRTIPTSLKLNGPTLSFVQNPDSATESLTGFATFIGIATAAYPSEQNETVDGTYQFHWYLGSTELFDTSVVSSSNADIVSIGNSSVLTLTGITYADSGKNVYLEVDYVPGANEGQPPNDLLRSAPATLTAFPEIVVTQQPEDTVVGAQSNAIFEIKSEISPDNGEEISYQWQLDDRDLINGTQNTDTVTENGNAILTVTSDAGDNFTIDFEELTTFSNFQAGRTYTITSNTDFTTRVHAVGGGGGTSRDRSVRGGSGGRSSGIVTFYTGESYVLQIGAKGSDGRPQGTGGFPGGGTGGGYGGGGGGGGYTGLFHTSATQANSIIIAGGGGGGANDPASGGNGGGSQGDNSSNAGRGGTGGTQSAGGRGGNTGNGDRGQAGGVLQGGNGAGGGGGGYYGGGGGGSYNGCCADGGGGGGSGYLSPTRVSDGSFSTTKELGGNPAQNGGFQIERVSATKFISVTASGVNTPKMTISTSDFGFGGVIRCKMTASNVQTSPFYSQSVSYDVVQARNLMQFEAFDNSNFKSSSNNFDTTSTTTLTPTTFGSNYSIVQFHSVEKDMNLRLVMKASKGKDRDSFKGGQGGVSTIEFTARKLEEHTILGLADNSALFLYRGSKLIAAVGSGGDAGKSGSGGDGGGVNVSGQDGLGRNGAKGGERALVGTLPINGTFGSEMSGSTIDLRVGDSIATSPIGGKTISCSKGSYWIDQGVAACDDNSSSQLQFTTIDGSVVTQSSFLERGFKPGYSVYNTAGKATTDGGNGGRGATGGNGGETGAGGGGGSGYYDGSVTLISSTLGGNNGDSSIEFSVVEL